MVFREFRQNSEVTGFQSPELQPEGIDAFPRDFASDTYSSTGDGAATEPAIDSWAGAAQDRVAADPDMFQEDEPTDESQVPDVSIRPTAEDQAETPASRPEVDSTERDDKPASDHQPAAEAKESGGNDHPTNDAPEENEPNKLTDEHRAVLDEMYRRYSGPLRSYAASNLGAGYDGAEDLVQEVFARAGAGLARGRFEPGTNARAWLYTIARNSRINDVRKDQRRPPLNLGADAERVLDQTPDPQADPEDKVVNAFGAGDFGQELRDIMGGDKTGQDRLTILYLTEVEGLQYKEVAERLGIPIGTVMSRIHRAKRDVKAARAARSQP